MIENTNTLTDEEYDDLKKIIIETLENLIDCADKHNIDRDSFVKYFSDCFLAVSELSTFEQYKKRSENNEC